MLNLFPLEYGSLANLVKPKNYLNHHTILYTIYIPSL